MVEAEIDEEGNVNFQPMYDNFKDFQVGMLVSCIQILHKAEDLKFFNNKIEHRAVNFYGIITKLYPDDWFLVNFSNNVGGKVVEKHALFHREELGWGYQMSWDWRTGRKDLHDWLSER